MSYYSGAPYAWGIFPENLLALASSSPIGYAFERRLNRNLPSEMNGAPMSVEQIDQKVTRWTLCLLLALACVAGCAPKPVQQDPQATAKLTASLHSGPPLTEEECRKFAEDFSLAVISGQTANAGALIDWSAMTSIAAVGLGRSEKDLQPFVAGLKQASTTSNGFTGQIVAEIHNGNSYELLRIHGVDSEPRVMFRLYGVAGLNYHDFLLARRPDGRVLAVDIEPATIGEKLSQTLRRALIGLNAERSQGILDRLQGKDSDFFKNLGKIQSINELVSGDQAQRGLDMIKTLPKSLQTEKVILLTRLRAATKLENQAEYDACIADFVTNFPNDTCLHLLLMDYFVTKEEYDNALKHLNIVDKNVGGDQYLDLRRANIQLGKGNFAEARKLAEGVQRLMPDRFEIFDLFIGINLKERKFDEVLRNLKELKTRFNVDFPDLTTLPIYGEFVKSPEYQEWLELLKSK
jgi:hypothetical protein